MFKEIKQPIYPYKVWVSDEEGDAINSKFVTKYEMDFPRTSVMRTFQDVGYKGDIGALIWINKELLHYYYRNTISSIVAHEAIHATNIMFTYLGASYTLDEDEHFAYFVQFITKQILDILYPNKDKDNK